jgi:homotetrameric cytidine deaminase
VSSPLRKVSLKARDADPAATLARALALGAEDCGEVVQRDTFFARARGRLKLRETGAGSALLVADDPAGDDALPGAYRAVEVEDAAALRGALDAALGTAARVTTRRRLLRWRGVRIHLDAVEGLGTFLELDAPGAEGSDLEAERALVAELRSELGVAEEAIVDRRYHELVLDEPATLLGVAREALRAAHAPYSGLRVGAALRGRGGGVFVGVNVENASFPQGQCAEASALGALVSAGETEVAAVAVVAEGRDEAPPCGGCLQRLSELAGPATPIHLGQPDGPTRTVALGELLPRAFGLERER